MNTQNITPEQLTNSVISVPPLARTVEGGISITENRKIVEHLKERRCENVSLWWQCRDVPSFF